MGFELVGAIIALCFFIICGSADAENANGRRRRLLRSLSGRFDAKAGNIVTSVSRILGLTLNSILSSTIRGDASGLGSGHHRNHRKM